MTIGNTVLELKQEGDVQRLKLTAVTESSIPETLNGESGFHIYHVRMLTELLLNQLKKQGGCSLSDEDVQAIAVASSLHDIGKSQIPQSILNFPGKLSPVEYDIVKKHAVFGESIINHLDFGDIDPKIQRYAAQIARAHHERYDGTGYPDGLNGDAIPLCAQVVSLADSYDALTSNRSYKDAFSQDVAVQMISSGMCGVFNEVLIDCLLKVVNHSALQALRETLSKKRAVIANSVGFAPERVLCIGNTQYVTNSFVEETFPSSKVMVIGNTELGSADKIKLFRIRKPSIKAVLETYDFDLIVFFSGDLTFHTTEKNDAEELREVLEQAKQLQKDTKIIFLSSLDSSFSQKTDRGILSAAKENLCQFYAREPHLDIKIVQIPYLYSGTYAKDFLYRVFDCMHTGKTAVIDSASTDQMHFLSLQDLSRLLARVIDNWKSGSGILTVADEFNLSFAEFGKRVCALCQSGTVDFTGTTQRQTLEANNKALRNEYGWFPRISLLEDLAEEYDAFLATKRERTQTWLDKLKKWLEEHSLFVKIAELILLFFITELLLYFTDSAVIFSIVDFRMVYIVVMATVHGLNFGLSAALLSSVSWLIAKVASGTNLLTIFYEPTNWLPFVFFVLVGALCGYVKLRKDDAIRFVTEQNRLLEDKLIFTREIYEDTHREKRDLKKQIIGSKDSFGKIFDITRRLDAVEPHLLYLRIMETFEEVLENKNITVYSVNKQSTFGRLEVASRDIIHMVSRSISTETYGEVIDQLHGGEIWRNIELKNDYPMYAAGVYRGDELVLLIFLWHANMDQRSLYYVNLFKILRDLVQMSLLRAFDYNQAVYQKQYIENTRIMQTDAFAECVRNFHALAEKKVSTYVLLEIDNEGRSFAEMDALLGSKVRANDVLGASPDGKVRLLLSQASEKDLPFVLPRFESLGLSVNILSKE